MPSLRPPAFKAILSSKIFFVLGILVVAGIIFAVSKISYRNYETERDISQLQQQLAQLEGDRKRLEELAAFFETDYFAEREARMKLGMQKDGEQATVIQRPAVNETRTEATNQEQNKSTQSEEEISSDKKNNSRAWWNYFFGME
jgi:cell division protein FtsB